MYSVCLSCSRPFPGVSFAFMPAGRTLAFDPQRGRMWVVCDRCTRWNLVPLEDRWEALELAEEAFMTSSRRHQSGNIGVAELSGDRRLIRIGAADMGELALWRYSRRLQSRRRISFVRESADRFVRYVAPVFVGGIVIPSAVASLPLAAALPTAALAGAASTLPARALWRQRARHVLVITAEQSVYRVADALGATLNLASNGDASVWLDVAPLNEVRRTARWAFGVDPIRKPVLITGADARRFLRRVLVVLNQRGATEETVEAAIATILRHGGPRDFVSEMARQEVGVGGRRRRRPASAPRLISPTDGIALEIALNEESERLALEGESATLSLAWEEAEVIAGIADAL